MVEVERTRTIQRQRTKVESFSRVPTPHEKFDEYKTEMLIEDDRFKLDLEVEPRAVKYVTNNMIQPVLSLPTKYIEGKYCIVDEKEFEDYLQRHIREKVKNPNIITLIDFNRPYDREFFASLVHPRVVFSGIVKWSEEGLSQPLAAGSEYVAKLVLQPGQEVYIRVPCFVPHGYLAKANATIYVPSGVKINFWMSVGGWLSIQQCKFPVDWEGVDDWARIGATWMGEQHNGGLEFVIYLKNDSSTVKNVYVAIISVEQVDLDKVSEHNCELYTVYNLKATITNESITFSLFEQYVFPFVSDKFFLRAATKVAGDGTNAITVDFIVNGVTYASYSTSSTTATLYALDVNVERKKRNWSVQIKYSTSGTGTIERVVLVAKVNKAFKITNKTYDSSTSTIDAGGTTTVAVFDYTTSTLYGNVKRIILERDSESVDLVCKDENGNVIAQLKGSYPGGSRLVLDCQHEFKDLLKLTVDVKNNDTANAHNYRIYVEYEEVDALLVK